MLSTDDLEKCAAVAEKNASVKKLLEDYLVFVESDVCDTYISVHAKLKTWNTTLKEDNTVDLKEAEKKFEREMKIVLEADNIHSVLEKLRGRMSEEQKEEVEIKTPKASGRNSRINDKRFAV